MPTFDLLKAEAVMALLAWTLWWLLSLVLLAWLGLGNSELVGIKNAYPGEVPKFLTKRSSKCARFSRQPWSAALASVF